MTGLRPMTERERRTWWINLQAAGARVDAPLAPGAIRIVPDKRWLCANTACCSRCCGGPPQIHSFCHTNHRSHT